MGNKTNLKPDRTSKNDKFNGQADRQGGRQKGR